MNHAHMNVSKEKKIKCENFFFFFFFEELNQDVLCVQESKWGCENVRLLKLGTKVCERT